VIGEETVQLKFDACNPYSTKAIGKIVLSETDASQTEKLKAEERHLCYISKDAGLARRAMLAEKSQDHLLLGELLGYPSCCSRFFVSNLGPELASRMDFVMPAIQNTRHIASAAKPDASVMNIFVRYFDMHLLSHAPCSFCCVKSMAQAARRADALRETDAGLHGNLCSLLSMAAIYSRNGIILLDATSCDDASSNPPADFAPNQLNKNKSTRINAFAEPYPSELSKLVLQNVKDGNREIRFSELCSPGGSHDSGHDGVRIGADMMLGNHHIDGHILFFRNIQQNDTGRL
jgi:hypothetical protein